METTVYMYNYSLNHPKILTLILSHRALFSKLAFRALYGKYPILRIEWSEPEEIMTYLTDGKHAL